MKNKKLLFGAAILLSLSSCSPQPADEKIVPLTADVYINRNGGYYVDDDTRFPGTMQVLHFTYGEEYLIPDVAKDGYTFTGWKTDRGMDVNPSGTWNINTNSITIIAQWEIINYSITYNLNGGTMDVDNPESYNIETETFVLNSPTKGNKKFAGWFLNGQKQSAVLKGSTGDIVFDAHWTDEFIKFNISSFGSYPQKKITDSELNSRLNALTTRNSKGNYVLDGKEYLKAGESYFSIDPIEWLELKRENNQVLLISKEILYTDVFKDTEKSYFIYHGKIHNSSNYAYSDIRKNLCNDFYNAAFSLEEKELIINDVLDNRGDGFLDSTCAVYSPFISTYDNVFLLDTLSYSGLGYQYDESDYAWQLRDQITPVTDYADYTGPCPSVQVLNYNFYFNMWYLRLPLEYVMLNQSNIVGTRYVSFSHSRKGYECVVSYSSPSALGKYGVRPCVRIPLEFYES